MYIARLARCAGMVTALLVGVVFTSLTQGQEKDFHVYSDHVTKHLARLYGTNEQKLAFRKDYPGRFAKWRRDARAAGHRFYKDLMWPFVLEALKQ